MATGKRTTNGVPPHRAVQAFNKVVEANLDPLGMTMPLVHAQLAWLAHPQELAEVAYGFSTRMPAAGGRTGWPGSSPGPAPSASLLPAVTRPILHWRMRQAPTCSNRN